MDRKNVLDHGFVVLRNISGPTRRTGMSVLDVVNNTPLRSFDADDTDPANAARMSFDASDQERTHAMEMKLNRYLLVNEHATPFESIVVWLEFKLPFFLARQFHRHRTQAINEVSARYTTLPAEWYIPEIVGGKSKDKKQGQEDNLSPEVQENFRTVLNQQCRVNYALYLNAIEDGVAPEHARMFLHMNHYTHYMSTVNLRNLFGFLALRCHSHAQIEARMYGEAIVDLLRPHLPELMKLFDEIVRKPEVVK